MKAVGGGRGRRRRRRRSEEVIAGAVAGVGAREKVRPGGRANLI